jgi:hypothetical protein
VATHPWGMMLGALLLIGKWEIFHKQKSRMMGTHLAKVQGK